MISGVLSKRASRDPDRVVIAAAKRRWTYAESLSWVTQRAEELASYRGGCVGLLGNADDRVILETLALDLVGARTYLLPPDLDNQLVSSLARELELGALIEASGEIECFEGSGQPTGPGEVVLFTSGTTGLPKAALHRWETLRTRIRVSEDLDSSSWLLTYRLQAFAGLQVFLHALYNGGRAVVGATNPAEMARLAATENVTHISGTPTFFRFMLSMARREDLERIHPRQLTLGGEAADQPILDALTRRFPEAHLTHVYASTEMGVCFSVHDGRAGFPASYLENEEMDVTLSIRDGELCIRSPRAMRGYLNRHEVIAPLQTFSTGDLVEERDGRVYFLGRGSERINVGGNKVFPQEVEAAILEVAGVRTARVSGVPSSLAGQLVRAEVVLDAGAKPEEIRARILAHCRARLRPYMVPRRLEFAEGLPQTASGKLARR